MSAATAAAAPLASTTEDFRLPGTQPLSLADPIATPDVCAPCHSNFGAPTVEPLRTWSGSMMAQAGRDPLMWAALAISNQDAPHSGETCLRCHLPKGWLEGRSTPDDGSAMTTADRHGVQCGFCHRMVDPLGSPGSPPEDAAILAALTAPVTDFGNAMFVVDPLDRRRGPFDVVADLGIDPHVPASTLVSPFHQSATLCGTCHNLRNTLYTKNTMTGEFELNPMNTPSPDSTAGFPEQSTFDEWAASTYASTGVYAPEFGGNLTTVATCQDCHMPDATARDAIGGVVRPDMPVHTFAGANTFIPAVLPFHPAFGAEVDPAALQANIEVATKNLRRAATVTGQVAGGNLTVRVTNETGHKLPTGYPEGRRMWLHVRAYDEDRNIVFESGRYTFSTATLETDPALRVWQTEQGISPAVAALVGLPAGKTFHLSLNNVRLSDNRIPPRGFTNAAFAAVDAEPVGATFADGQHWDEVVYAVGTSAVAADVTLYYQNSSREYVEFLRDANTTTAAGNILHTLWQDHNKSEPVAMAQVRVETDTAAVASCSRQVSKVETKYQKRYAREWSRCFASRVQGLTCDTASVDARIAAEADKLRSRLGGVKDRRCAAPGLTPGTLGHGTSCPFPCAGIVVFDLPGLADCAICLGDALGNEALEAAYGTTPPALPAPLGSTQLSCQQSLGRAADVLTSGWSRALARCEDGNATGKTTPPVDCTTDPDGRIAKAKSQAGRQVDRCDDFSGIPGCAGSGDAAAVKACMETAVGAVVVPYTQVAYP